MVGCEVMLNEEFHGIWPKEKPKHPRFPCILSQDTAMTMINAQCPIPVIFSQKAVENDTPLPVPDIEQWLPCFENTLKVIVATGTSLLSHEKLTWISWQRC